MRQHMIFLLSSAVEMPRLWLCSYKVMNTLNSKSCSPCLLTSKSGDISFIRAIATDSHHCRVAELGIYCSVQGPSNHVV